MAMRAGGTPLVLTLGDPNGIGPEVLLKALDRCLAEGLELDPVLSGPRSYLERLARDLSLHLDWTRIECLDGPDYPYPPPWGEIGLSGGRLAVEALRSGVQACRERSIPLLVTAPVSKTACAMAGFSFPGQTEFVASHFDADPAMAFFSDRFHLVLVTTHIPLRRVPEALASAEVIRKSRLFYDALRRTGVARPRLALCGLNPHASEEGMFGDEEERLLKPAAEALRSLLGPNSISDPLPPDTLFHRVLKGEFDGVVALYHDQGLIPLKMIAFDSAVNVTLGLPLVRTSPDHGTAFDIAGRNQADPSSMAAAIRWGLRLSQPAAT